MTKSRISLLAFLVLGPFVFLIGAGSFHLYSTGWGFIAWWPMALSLTAAYLLGWRWTRKNRAKLLPDTGKEPPPLTWTDRDKLAWQVVLDTAAKVENVSVDQFADADRYSKEAQALALAVAKVYKPDATDPFGHLTLPEILACGELVSRDLSRRVREYIPGSHLMRIQDWKRARQAVDIGEKAWNVSWLARMALDPINAGAQFLASRAGAAPLRRIQDNVLHWFHTAYLHELGRHLIELNSGRLKVGAERYLELTAPPAENAPPSVGVRVAIVGPVKAGKSSLVNALLGESKAGTDVLPLTNGATQYVLPQEGGQPLTLIDTAGYGLAGPTDEELAEAVEAAVGADLILMATPARNAARAADVSLLTGMQNAFAKMPGRNLPPVLAVLTQADALTPAAEWAPPYDWKTGTRLKELSIRDAVAAGGEAFVGRVLDTVPVCGAAGKEWNISDGLAEAMASRLDAARGAAVLRAFHAEGSAHGGRKVVKQLLNVGREALAAVLKNATEVKR